MIIQYVKTFSFGIIVSTIFTIMDNFEVDSTIGETGMRRTEKYLTLCPR